MPRHLPIVPSHGHGRDAEPGGPGFDAGGAGRSRWQWTAIGALAAVSLWAPLAMLASAASARGLRALLGSSPPARIDVWLASAGIAAAVRFWLWLVGAPAAAFALACGLGGTIMGRFGGKRVGVRHGAVAGLAAALFGWVVMLSRGTNPRAAIASLVAISALGAGAASLGVHLGCKLNRGSHP